jgi:hypothetical protein
MSTLTVDTRQVRETILYKIHNNKDKFIVRLNVEKHLHLPFYS